MTESPQGTAKQLLPGLDSDVLYEGWGQDVLDAFVRPALARSESYDRLTGYFTVESLIAVAEGIGSLWKRGGEMRLVVGIHDVPREIVEAKQLDEEALENLVQTVRNRLIEEASTIEEELQRDKLATLAWMMQDGLLEVRVACPVPHKTLPREGIFHKKRLIFRDRAGNTLVGVGSPNETAAGFRENIEELTVFRDWESGQRPFVESHVESFETIWEDQREYIQVTEIDESFAEDLLESLESPSRPDERPEAGDVSIGDVLDTAARSPAYSVLSFDNVGLYPHQERVFVEGLSRWPVRVLLADEVGLGKTLEAGAILAYLLRFGGIDEATILAPANLLKQWQEELDLHFGIEFWRWDSDARTYVSPEGEQWRGGLDGDPVGPDAPSQVLISAQLARGTKNRGHIFEETDRRPDFLLVDEAHAARVRPTLDGTTRPTRLWRTLDDITAQIPHVVFTTATPLQTNLEEYHALLDLLGLSGIWEDFEAYERSLKILSNGEKEISLHDAQWMLKLMGATVNGMDHWPRNLSSTEKDLLEVAKDISGSPSFEEASKVVADKSSAYSLFLRLHPAHLLTLRNSQLSLQERGYHFPERVFESPALDTPLTVDQFYDDLHEYLWEAYGTVEEAADPNRETSLGFAKSSYHQRTASSLHAAVTSLKNRRSKIEGIVEGMDADEDILEEEYEEPSLEEDEESTADVDVSDQRRLERAKNIESAYIDDLLNRLNDITDDGEIRDPKMEMMIEILEDHLPEDGVLIFSRYTDTLDACLQTFENQNSGNLDVGYGLYTGQDAWIQKGGTRTSATKEDVKVALEDDEIKIVFCSEAASEGLNLQGARVMINIDVPWNPAKLEQRIGRIARLGQSAEEVLIYNLWYPDSVEAKMYSRLTERKNLYDIAVGQSPEIVSDAIRSRIGSGDGGEGSTEEALDELGEIRHSIQHQAMQQVWGSMEDPMPLSTKAQSEMLRVIAQNTTGATLVEGDSGNRLLLDSGDGDQIEVGSEPEDRSILTLNHEVLRIISKLKGSLPPEDALLVIEDSITGDPIALCLERGDSIAIIPPSDLPLLIELLVSRDSIDELIQEEEWQQKNDVDLKSAAQAKSRWLPNHEDMTTHFDSSAVDGELPPSPWSNRLELSKL